MQNHTHMEDNNNNNYNNDDNDQLLEIQDKFEKGLALVEEPSSSSIQVNWDDDDDDDDEDEDVVFVLDENDNDNDNDDDEDEDEEGSQDGGFEFSFASGEEIKSPVSAEELFLNGKIRPTLPFSVKGTEREASGEEHYLPPVKKVFVVSKNDSPKEGPYCVWSTAPPENDVATPEMSKKSNSTGFSKLWRMKDLLVRSNSDGKDTFVFLPRKGEQPEKKVVDKKKMKVVSLGRIKVGGGGKKEGGTVSLARSSHTGNEEKKKGKKPSMMAAYEALYGKKKGGVGDKDKSYLPYKVGFFTNSSGMTKNVHPY